MPADNEQPVFGETRYVDPNSGAAPQPGGMAIVHVVEDDKAEEEHPDGNITMPGEERELTEAQENDPTGGVEALPDEVVFGGPTLETEQQNQAMPLDDDVQGSAANPYAAPGVAADEDGNALKDDGSPVEEPVEIEGETDDPTIETERQNQAAPLEDEGGTPATEEGGAAETTEQPGGNASKADWTEYAKSQGATDADLEGKTRDEIRDAYSS